jgi:competence protein ComGF
VLWEHHNLIYHIFDYYATLGASTDIFHIDFNAYQVRARLGS